jgi:hypothetical protein
MLPYFMRHYQPYVERFIIHDDSSNDGSVEFLRQYPNLELNSFKNRSNLFVFSFVKKALKFSNNEWKKSRGEADWVIVCSIDEHLYHENLLGYLEYCQQQGITILPTLGYQMVSDRFPQVEARLCDTVVKGTPLRKWNKICIFNPNAIEEINYEPGRHTASPTGNVVFPKTTEIKLLHYKYLGIDYLKERQAQLATGMRIGDKLKKFGYHYFKEEAKFETELNQLLASAKPVINC